MSSWQQFFIEVMFKAGFQGVFRKVCVNIETILCLYCFSQYAPIWKWYEEIILNNNMNELFEQSGYKTLIVYIYSDMHNVSITFTIMVIMDARSLPITNSEMCRV